MNINKLKLILFLLPLFQNVYAGITIGPFIGGEFHSWKSEESFPMDSYDVSGTQQGYALGWHYGSRISFSPLKGLFLGVSYYQAADAWNLSDDPDTSNDDSWLNVSATRKSLSIFLGLQKPGTKGPLYQIWAGLGIKETLVLNEAHQPSKDPITYEGRSYILGYSWPLNSWFYANVEYNLVSMTKRTQGGTEATIPYDKNFETYELYQFHSLLLSISMPITFFKKKIGW